MEQRLVAALQFSTPGYEGVVLLVNQVNGKCGCRLVPWDHDSGQFEATAVGCLLYGEDLDSQSGLIVANIHPIRDPSQLQTIQSPGSVRIHLGAEILHVGSLYPGRQFGVKLTAIGKYYTPSSDI